MQNQNQQQGTPVKIVIVGDGNVGKTSILLSYTTEKFPETYIPTVFDNYSAQVKVDDQVINLGLWDTAGQEDFHKIRPLSYPQTDVFIITFAVNEPASFENASRKWFPELKENCPEVPIIFVGNKTDLRVGQDDTNKFVNQQVANKVCTTMGCKYFECSAKTQDGLKQIFEEGIRIVLQKKQKGPKKISRKSAESQKNSDQSCNIA